MEGKQDKTGTLYRRNRSYDPLAGRFTQEDPIGLAGGVNLYGFAAGDPVNFADPFGLCPHCGAALIAGGIVGGIRLFDNLRRGRPAFEGVVRDAVFGFAATVTLGAAAPALVGAGGDLVAGGAPGAVEQLRTGGRLIGRAGTSSKIRLLEGGPAEAEALFSQLSKGGRIVEGSTFPGTLVELSGGGRVGLRLSSQSGPPTIDVFIKGLGVREIKFIP